MSTSRNQLDELMGKRIRYKQSGCGPTYTFRANGTYNEPIYADYTVVVEGTAVSWRYEYSAANAEIELAGYGLVKLSGCELLEGE